MNELDSKKLRLMSTFTRTTDLILLLDNTSEEDLKFAIFNTQGQLRETFLLLFEFKNKMDAMIPKEITEKIEQFKFNFYEQESERND